MNFQIKEHVRREIPTSTKIFLLKKQEGEIWNGTLNWKKPTENQLHIWTSNQ